MPSLGELADKVSELQKLSDDAQIRKQLLGVVDGAIDAAKKEAAAKSEEGNKTLANEAAILLAELNKRLADIELDILRGERDSEPGPASDEADKVEEVFEPLSALLQMGMDKTGIKSALDAANIGEDKKKSISEQLSQLPELTNEYINALPTMFTYDRKNLGKATLGMAAVAAGVAILAIGLSATNPVGWLVLGGAILGFGISLAAKAIKEHKNVMKERAEAGEDIETPLDVARDVLQEKKKSLINSAPKPAQHIIGSALEKAEELAKNEGIKRLKAAVEKPR
jgi:hypothetical protein